MVKPDENSTHALRLLIRKTLGSAQSDPHVWVRNFIASGIAPAAAHYVGGAALSTAFMAGVGALAALAFYDAVWAISIDSFISRRERWLVNGRPTRLFLNDIHAEERRSPKSSQIYVFTPNLELDISDPPTVKTVGHNLEHNSVSYSFIVPVSDTVQAALPSLARLHREFEKEITIFLIDPDWMRLAAYDNLMLIVEPDGKKRGYMQIPEGSTFRWAQMSEKAANACEENLGFFRRQARIPGGPYPPVRIIKLSDAVSNLDVLFSRLDSTATKHSR